MAHLIDKDALVAEIEERLAEVKKLSHSKEVQDEYGKGYCNGKKSGYKKILSAINTLEVKEVKEEPERRNPYSSQIDTDTCWDDGNF